MKNYTFLFVALCAALSAQPTIPVGNLYPVTANSIIGNVGPAGRAEAIPIGSGLAFSGGALIATGGGGGSGTVTSIPDGSTNGVTWTVATRTTTPTFTFTLGAITPTSIVASSTITGSNLSGTNTGDQNLWRNIVVSGQDTVIPVTTTSSLTLAAGANITLTTNNSTKTVTIASSGGGGSGNVTASGTLTSGNVIVGGGTTVVAASNVTISGNDITIPGNATISGNTTFGNLTTGNLTVTGNITSTTVTDGQLFIGNNTGDRLQLATLTAGDGISITNGAGSVTINATGGGGSGTVNSGTAGQMAYYPASAAAVSGTVLPKFEIAGTNNVSAFTLYNAMTYPFAKTDTTGRNIFWVGSNDASNPFGVSFNATGHGSTATSRIIRMDVGAIGVNELGQLRINAYQTDFLTREAVGNIGLRLVSTDATSTISQVQTNGSLKIHANGTGGVQIGESSYSPTTHSIPALIHYPFSKTDTSARNGLFIGSNDSSNPWGVMFNFTGNSTATDREMKMQTTAVGADGSGKIRFGATSFTFYSNDNATLALALTSAGQVSAEQTTASTSTTTGALVSKGGLGVAGNIHTGGDVEIADIGEGVIIKSPDGTRYRLTVANGGTLVITGL